MVEFKHILFPCDLTENSIQILPFAIHTIFGSVAQNVARRSPVPVLTITPYKLK